MDELDSAGWTRKATQNPGRAKNPPVVKTFDEMRLSSPELRQQFPVPFAELPPESILERKLYVMFGAFLAGEKTESGARYFIKKGENAAEFPPWYFL